MKNKVQKAYESKIAQAEEQIKQHSTTIDYSTAEFTLEVIYSKLKREDFYIPDYQRKDIWNIKQKSKFIESLLMGLPIPFLFFWQNEEGKLEIVDGAQRLTSIKQFFDNEYKLSNLEKLTYLEGFYFSDLVDSRRRKFRDLSIRSIMLTERADALTRFDLFERINTTGKHLEPSELRRGLLRGDFLNMVESLSLNQKFIKMFPAAEQQVAQGVREEAVSRFFAYSDGLENYKNSIKNFIFLYTNEMNNQFRKDKGLRTKYENRFNSIIDFYYQRYPNGFKTNRGIRSNARFESLMIGAYLAFKEDEELKNTITTQDLNEFCTTSEYIRAVKSDSSNTKSRLILRLNITRDYFLSKSKINND